ncbi:MAG: outer membrane beta-barrel protein [Candidatus Krumholzibacteriia bacterium]
MKRLMRCGSIVMCLVFAVGGTAYAQLADGVGLRGGIGTDISGGLAFGAEINYTRALGFNGVELSLAFFGGSFDESTNEGIHTYDETTDIFVVGAIANYLFLYSLEKPGPYFVAGVGVGAISVDWEERSLTDTSLGTALPGGGSMQAEDATSGGTIVNFGIGHRFTEQLDVRAQIPTFFVFSAPGEATAVVPTFTATVGYRF